MQFILIGILVLFASTSKAQMRAEFNLAVTPSFKLERTYWTESTDRREGIVAEKHVDSTVEQFPTRSIQLIATNNTKQGVVLFNKEQGGLPRSLKHRAELMLPILLEVKEQENVSKTVLKLSSSFKEETEPFTNINIDLKEIFQYHFDQIKVSGSIKIQYLVPQKIRQLYVISSALEKGLSHAQTIGLEGTLTEELEQGGYLERFAFVQPLSVVEQTIDIPERTFTSLSDLESYFEITIKRNLHIPGVLK